MEFLQTFRPGLEITYKPGKVNPADALSRRPDHLDGSSSEPAVGDEIGLYAAAMAESSGTVQKTVHVAAMAESFGTFSKSAEYSSAFPEASKNPSRSFQRDTSRQTPEVSMIPSRSLRQRLEDCQKFFPRHLLYAHKIFTSALRNSSCASQQSNSSLTTLLRPVTTPMHWCWPQYRPG